MATKPVVTYVPLCLWKQFRKECIDNDFTSSKAIRMSMCMFLDATHNERIAMHRKYKSRCELK